MSSSQPNFVIIGDGNNITTDAPGTVTANGQTVDAPAGSTVVVNGNKVTVQGKKR